MFLIKSYQQALDFLYNRNQFSIKLGLQNIKNLLDYCDNPQSKQIYIQVGGTNGKGSTSHYLSQLLSYYNYFKIGLYTSPHLADFRERIKINHKLISKTWILTWIKKYQQIIEKLGCTYFEVITAMALCYFTENNCDIVILEVGLGGRLDSTSIVNPKLSIITSVDYDHCNILGNTLKKIWEEKIGMIKPNTSVVSGEQRISLKKRLQTLCLKNNSPLYFIKTTTYQTGFIDGIYHKIKLPPFFLGEIHLKNLTLALQSLEFWKGPFPQPLLTSITSKLGCQTIFKKNNLPITLIDGSHNTQSIKSLLKFIQTHFPEYSWDILFSHLNDKNYVENIKLLNQLKIKDKKFFELSKISRHLPFSRVQEIDSSWDLWGNLDSLSNYLENTKKSQQGFLICGSFYLIGEIISELKKIYSS